MEGSSKQRLEASTLEQLGLTIAALHLLYCLYCAFHSSGGMVTKAFPLLTDARLAAVCSVLALAAACAACVLIRRAQASSLVLVLLVGLWAHAVYHRSFVYGRSALELTYELFIFSLLLRRALAESGAVFVSFLLGVVMLSAGVEKANLGYLDGPAFRQYLVNPYSSTLPGIWSQLSDSHPVFSALTRALCLGEIACGVLLIFQQRRVGGLMLILIALGMLSTQFLMLLPCMYLLLGVMVFVSGRTVFVSTWRPGALFAQWGWLRNSGEPAACCRTCRGVLSGVATALCALSMARSLFGVDLGAIRCLEVAFPLGPHRMYTQRVHDPYCFVVRNAAGQTLLDPRQYLGALRSGLCVDIEYRNHREIMSSICFREGEQESDGLLARTNVAQALQESYLRDWFGPGTYEILVWDFLKKSEVKTARFAVGPEARVAERRAASGDSFE